MLDTSNSSNNCQLLALCWPVHSPAVACMLQGTDKTISQYLSVGISFYHSIFFFLVFKLLATKKCPNSHFGWSRSCWVLWKDSPVDLKSFVRMWTNSFSALSTPKLTTSSLARASCVIWNGSVGYKSSWCTVASGNKAENCNNKI